MKKLIFKLVSLTAVAATLASPVMAASYNNRDCYINQNDCYNNGNYRSTYSVVDKNSPDEFFTYEYASKNWQVLTAADGRSYVVVDENGNKGNNLPTNCYSYCNVHCTYDTCGTKYACGECSSTVCKNPNNCTPYDCNNSWNCNAAGNCNNYQDCNVPGNGNNNGGTGSGNNGSGSTVEVAEFEEKVIELVNAERAKVGLSALKTNKDLVSLARIKSQDMKDNNYFSHNSPTLGSAFDMMKAKGVKYNTAGENIAMGQSTPEAVVTAWMNSPGHRANILKEGYTEIGVGYVAKGNYWTQMFIG